LSSTEPTMSVNRNVFNSAMLALYQQSHHSGEASPAALRLTVAQERSPPRIYGRDGLNVLDH
jgi:hypothetical protein